MVRYILAVCLLILSVSPSRACGILEEASPKVGSTVSSIDYITLTFSQAIDASASNVKIINDQGKEITGTKLMSDKNTVLSLRTDHFLSSGRYKVSWNVLWTECGCPTQGKYKFTVTDKPPH